MKFTPHMPNVVALGYFILGTCDNDELGQRYVPPSGRFRTDSGNRPFFLRSIGLPFFPSPPHLFLGGRILPPKYFGYQKVCGELRSWLNLVEGGGSHKNYISVPGTFLELEQ